MTAHGPLDLPSLRGLTILVVDDNDDALELLTTFLNACHADVLSARTATGAPAYIDTTPSLDAVVTDIAMPDVNGVELVRKIRQHSARKSIR
jgi:CheY-like chemotaxis protein